MGGRQRSIVWMGVALLLATSMTIDAVFRADFVPGLFSSNYP